MEPSSLYKEELLTFSEAAACLPRIKGKKIAISSVWRWARKGIKGVRLECVRVGGRFFTSKEALERFAKKLAKIEPAGYDRRTKTHPPRTRTAKQRQRDIERAEKELTEAGI